MRAVRQRGLRTAFVVGLEDLQRADQILASAGPRSYFVELQNGRQLIARSLDELAETADFKVREIRRIEIATEWREILRATLTLQRDRKLPALTYNLIGEERSVVNVASALDDWMKSVRVWYSRIATMDIVSLLLSTWLAVLLAFSMAACLMAYTDWFALDSESGFVGSLAVAMWTVPFLLGTIVNFLRNGLFPIGTYLFLDGSRWHFISTKARKLLGGGFLLSIVAAFVASLVATMF